MDVDDILYKWAATIYNQPIKDTDIKEMKSWAESRVVTPHLHKFKYTSNRFFIMIVSISAVVLLLAYLFYKPSPILKSDEDEVKEEVENVEEIEEIVPD